MHPILFKVGSLTFYTHGVLAVVGIIVTCLTMYYFAGREKLDREFLFDNMIYTVLFGIIGARLTYFFLYRDQFSSLKEILYLQDGGMVSYGGFILGLLTFYLIYRADRKNLMRWLDILAIGFAFGLFFGRIGNIMAGEYAGRITSSRYAISGIIPVTLYEGILVLLLGIIMKWKFLRKKSSSSGQYFLGFLLFYGFGRFIIDYWRDEKVLFLAMNLGQIISLIIGIIALIVLMRRRTNLEAKDVII